MNINMYLNKKSPKKATKRKDLSEMVIDRLKKDILYVGNLNRLVDAIGQNGWKNKTWWKHAKGLN